MSARKTNAETKQLQEELLKTREELDRRYRDLQRIYNIVNSIHSTLSLTELSHAAKDLLEKSLNLGAYTFMVYDQIKKRFVFSRTKNLPHQVKQKVIETLEQIQPAWKDRPDQIEIKAKRDKKVASLSAVCVPLYAHHRMVGALCAPTDTLSQLSDYDREILSVITTQLAVAIDNSMLYEITKKLAITDDQTELYNHRYLLSRLDLELRRAERFSRSCSFLMIDIDDFKIYNDRFGHLMGDVVLAEIAKMLRKECRVIDVLARYGGEEFSAILPETNQVGAKSLADRILKAISNHRFFGEKHKRTERLSVSIGIANSPENATTRTKLINAADKALYRAKRKGKNQYAVA